MLAVYLWLVTVLLTFALVVLATELAVLGRFHLFDRNCDREGVAAKKCEYSFLSKQVIKNPFADNVPYLTRYILIRCPWFRIFLHRFHGPDPDRHLHNHPWRAFSIILKGGYTEQVWTPLPSPLSSTVRKAYRFHTALSINHIAWDCYHKIADVEAGTWSLVFGGQYERSWGFLVDGAHVPWRTYLNLASSTTLED